jgi:transcription elongation factor GreA
MDGEEEKMSNDNVVYLTREGLAKIKEELEFLKNDKRTEISMRLEDAIKHGDISENADYDYAKQEQAFVEGRIKDLEDSLRRAQIIENDGPSDTVRVGSTVTVVEDGLDEDETYCIVGIHEADPSGGRISNESPIGQALLGARVGQTVTVGIPAGEIRLRIKAID